MSEERSRREETATLARTIPNDEKRLDQLADAAPGLQAWTDKNTKDYLVGRDTFTVRKDASDQLLERLREAYVQLRAAGPSESAHVATFAEIPLHVTRMMEHDTVFMRFGDLPIPGISITQEQLWPARDELFGEWRGSSSTETWHSATDNDAQATNTNRAAMANGIMTRIENVIARAPVQLGVAREELEVDRQRLDELRTTPAEPFAEEAKLQTMKTELNSLNDSLAAYENSDAARTAREELEARLGMNGRDHGWSLMLNPTPKYVEALGYETADEVRDLMWHRQVEAWETWSQAPEQQATPNFTQIITESYLERRDREKLDPDQHWKSPDNGPNPDNGPEH